MFESCCEGGEGLKLSKILLQLMDTIGTLCEQSFSKSRVRSHVKWGYVKVRD